MKEPQVLEGNCYRLVEKVSLCLLRFSMEREQASLLTRPVLQAKRRDSYVFSTFLS